MIIKEFLKVALDLQRRVPKKTSTEVILASLQSTIGALEEILNHAKVIQIQAMTCEDVPRDYERFYNITISTVCRSLNEVESLSKELETDW